MLGGLQGGVSSQYLHVAQGGTDFSCLLSCLVNEGVTSASSGVVVDARLVTELPEDIADRRGAHDVQGRPIGVCGGFAAVQRALTDDQGRMGVGGGVLQDVM